MPTSAPRRCRTCQALVKDRCPDCDRGWARKPPSWQGVSKRAWRVFREAWLADHPWCMDCGARATVVCHERGTDYLRDRLNPEAIEGQRCQPCDARETSRQGRASQLGH